MPKLQVAKENIDTVVPAALDNITWIKHRHPESIKLILSKLSDPDLTLNEMEIFKILDDAHIVEQVCIDDFIFKNLQYYADKVTLLISLAYTAIIQDYNTGCKRSVFNPLPKFVKSFDEIYSMVISSNVVLKVGNLSKNKNVKNDLDILDILGFDLYRFVKHTLYQTQHMDIKQSHLFSSDEIRSYMETSKRSTANINLEELDIRVYEVLHPLDDDTKWDSKFMFHGSPYFNWFSILNNGLYVPEKSQILNANAYGSGVYLAENASTSLGYSANYHGKYIMAIVQVNNNVKFNYGADKTIIVVHNKEAIRVKYLIYFDMTEAKTAHYFINDFFNFMTTKINDIKKKNDLVKSDTIFNKICLKRLTAEIKQVQKADQIYGYPVKITYDEATIHIWKVEIESPKERWGKMTWEIRFNNDFPVQPPFVRIVTPAFKYQTGHITVGGAFCNPILTNQKWRSSVSILALLETLLVNMEEGGAQLDTVQKGPYNYQEALAAYNRYKTAHGW